ncbi:hypothetical protein AUL38_02315 [Leucobacter sp. G161]|nr:hypothetical protein AUL38_02315 [Leucobacter sp. G161]
MASARKSFGAVLDSAERGRAVTIRRHSKTAAVVQVDQLRAYFASTLNAHAEVFSEDGRWVVLLRGRSFVSEGLTVDEAIDDLIASLREYAEDWEDRLSSASNHQANWALVQLITLSTDDELRAWIENGGE